MPQLTPELVQAFRRLDTCSVSNAIETFDCRLRNEGFADSTIRCLFEDLPPIVGHAATARIHCSTPPPVGHSYYDRTDWWTYILSVPPPRVIVVEDADPRPGTGAFIGEVHANILKALGCVAYATNGSVRDLPAVHSTGFQLFAPSVAVSHAYVHIVDFGQPVTVGDLRVCPGDILHGDCHGLVAVPAAIAAEVPAVAERMRAAERDVIAFCRSSDFALDKLRNIVRHLG